MSVRLDLIKTLIEPAEIVADVGCDHGLIAEYCANSDTFGHVIASDISDKSLQKARDLLGARSNVEFVCCDGMGYECDEAVISGMGGMLICDILRNAVKLPKTVIASAHTDSDKVRKCLIELGYGIDKDVAVIDRNKFYSVIRAKQDGGTKELNDLQLLFGVDCAEPSPALESRLKRLYDVYMQAPSKNAERLEKVIAALRLQGVNVTTFTS